MLINPLNLVFDIVVCNSDLGMLKRVEYKPGVAILSNCVLSLICRKYQTESTKISKLISRGYEQSASKLLGGMVIEKLCPIPTFGRLCVVEVYTKPNNPVVVVGTIRSVIEHTYFENEENASKIVIKELYPNYEYKKEIGCFL